ncbi:MAG: hypothetical protein DWQ01_07570 [Planctomycetota bacterium]|nr:MAG: hypothetical protein DWQ01_07570 [Planctomycetota bacterium]
MTKDDSKPFDEQHSYEGQEPEADHQAEPDGPETDPVARRKFLKLAGLMFFTGGFTRAAGALNPRAACGAPHGTGVGYQEDYRCDKQDDDCGLVTSNPAFGGRGGAAYHDNDCASGAAQDGQDNDCGKSKGWAGGAHKDNDCGKLKDDGTYTSDQDCNVDTGEMFNGGWQDHDCGLKSGENTTYSDENPGYDDDEVCEWWDSNCTYWDTFWKPKRGDDPACIHLDSN